MNYYNENDPSAAAWLLGLIEDGLIPNGEVDVRSITEVQPADLMGFTQWHFFAGIAGWSRALQLAGWPSTRGVITGSCPCQPFSAAGKGKGNADERHLWPEFARIIRGLRELGCTAPVMGEQVASKLGRAWLAGVRSDLEAMAHGVWAVDLCSAGVGSPNIRQRLYWMAYCKSSGAGPGERRIRQVDSGHSTDGRLADASCSDGERGAGGVPETEAGIGGTDGQLHGDRPVGLEHGGEAQLDRLAVAGLSGSWRPAGCEEEAGRRSSGESSGSGDASQSLRLGHANDSGLQGWGVNPERAGECPTGPAMPFGDHGGTEGTPWCEYDVVHCRDGKSRRIPAASLGAVRRDRATESGLQCMAHGLQPGMDTLWHQGYPLSWQKIESRPAILKGIGNAINPYVAAEFIKAFKDDIQ